jgi:hypothetical protein
MAKVSWDWMVLAIVPYCLLWVLIFIKREILGNPSPLPDWYEALYALCFTVFSVAIMFLILAYFLRFKQSGWSALDPDAGGRLRHVPGALPDRALAAILAVRLRPAGDRQGDDGICADGRVQLGADARIAANPRSGQGALVVYVNWFLSVKPKVLESGGYRVELMRGPRSGMACFGFRRIEIAQLCSVCVSLLNQRDNDQLDHPDGVPDRT